MDFNGRTTAPGRWPDALRARLIWCCRTWRPNTVFYRKNDHLAHHGPLVEAARRVVMQIERILPKVAHSVAQVLRPAAPNTRICLSCYKKHFTLGQAMPIQPAAARARRMVRRGAEIQGRRLENARAFAIAARGLIRRANELLFAGIQACAYGHRSQPYSNRLGSQAIQVYAPYGGGSEIILAAEGRTLPPVFEIGRKYAAPDSATLWTGRQNPSLGTRHITLGVLQHRHPHLFPVPHRHQRPSIPACRQSRLRPRTDTHDGMEDWGRNPLKFGRRHNLQSNGYASSGTWHRLFRLRTPVRPPGLH